MCCVCKPNINKKYGIYEQGKPKCADIERKVEKIDRLEKGETGSSLAKIY